MSSNEPNPFEGPKSLRLAALLSRLRPFDHNADAPSTMMPPRISKRTLLSSQALSPLDNTVPATDTHDGIAKHTAAEEGELSDDAEEFLKPDQHHSPPPLQTMLPHFGTERQYTRLLERGRTAVRPTLTLTTPDTRNDEDEINAAICKTWTLDENKRPREGLTLPSSLSRRGSKVKGIRVWWPDESPLQIRQTPRPETPRWEGDEAEGMETLWLGEGAMDEEVELNEKEVEVLRVPKAHITSRKSQKGVPEEGETFLYVKKIGEEKEVDWSSPVNRALAMMGTNTIPGYETADKGTQDDMDWEYDPR